MPTKNIRRRRLLATTALGVGGLSHRVLPESWSKPLVNSVLLPVHAEMTVAEMMSIEEEPPMDEACSDYAGDVSLPCPTTTQCVEIIETPIGVVVVPCGND